MPNRDREHFLAKVDIRNAYRIILVHLEGRTSFCVIDRLPKSFTRLHFS